MSNVDLKIRLKDRARVLANLRRKFQVMRSTHGYKFGYDVATAMIAYIRNKKRSSYYRLLVNSRFPAERFVVTIVTEIIQFSKTEAETFSVFCEFLFWIVQDFGTSDSKKLDTEENNTPTLFIGPDSIYVH